MPVKIKICGLTNLPDALAALEAGADALGFMFYAPSPRHITSAQAAEIIRALPPFVTKVGVFVNSPAEIIRATLAECALDVLQFHGDESPADCRRFGRPAIKAFRVRDAESLRALPAYAQETWLLDSFVPGAPGGTGTRFNWELAAAARERGGRIILAGGLTAENVAAAVRQVRPYAVDVSSGVESAPGQKDARRLREFITQARGA